ncbi:LysR family transcriptional regulator [Massilia aerilata]|uniref:LysR family transcriptional regulator n=1 Tax=Massilia aerilata TaxID=453817 RepID=A0ABW0S1W2_9BURK
MNKLTAMECFVRAVETGSFSAVGRELGIGQPNVSRNIAALEQSLGTQLLHRSTRSLAVTPEGQRYYEQARAALDLIGQAESDARGQRNPQGLLRMACSQALGAEKIIAAMPGFMARYPDLELDLLLSDAYADLVAEGLDLAVRGGVLADSALRARRLGSSERVHVASTAYLDARGTPDTPAALAQHECILYTHIARGDRWPFREGEVQVGGRMRVNNLEGIRRAVIGGIGIGYLPSWMVWDQVRDGSLRVVLAGHATGPTPIHAVYAAQRLLPQRAVVFIDYMAEVFAATPGLNGSSVLD